MTTGAFINLAISGGEGEGRCYRLDPALIGRFYIRQTRRTKTPRILTGQPPVSVSCAARASGVAP